MKIREMLTYKKIIQSLLVIMLGIFCYAFAGNIVSIDDGPTPLSGGNVEAMFYIENPETGTMTCIGDGLIKNPSEIYNDEASVSDKIVSAPNYSAITGTNLTVVWHSIKHSENEIQVFGVLHPNDATTNSTVFSSVEEMKSANVSLGDTVSTLGFYSANDGGGATYTIRSGSSDGMFNIPLNNGLIASLQILNNEVFVDQLGAKGDGTTDDVLFIQKAFDSGYSVAFSSGKTYKLISNGLTIQKNLTIKGNNATILIDDSYNPSSSDFQNFVIRYSFKSLDNLRINDLNIDCKINEPSRYIGSNYLCILQPHYIKNISLTNLNINVYESENKIINFWMFHGCDNLALENCHFHNDTIDSEGGIIFIDGETDKYFNYYNGFKNITVNNCQLTGHCSDEAIAIWGPNSVNFKMTASTINWTHALRTHYSRPINITCDPNPNTIYNIYFENCNITADSPNADSVIGVGSLKPSNMNIYFKSCNINANVRDSLLHFQSLPSNPSKITEYDFTTDKYNINFDSCNINCSKTITGSNKFYNDTSYANWALDCNFNNCNITCSYCFAFIERYNTSKYYYVPEININDCTVNINDSIGFIYKSNYSAVADIDIDNCDIKAPELNKISTYRYQTNNGNGLTQSNLMTVNTTISETTLNSKSINN